MGIRLWRWLGLPAGLSLLLFASCDQHEAGELPEVQKEHILPLGAQKAAESDASAEQTPAPKPTPADFFPPAKP